MAKYKITLDNGKHPLTYECDTLEAVSGCLRGLSGWVPMLGAYDVEDIIDALQGVENGKVERQLAFSYSLTVGDVSKLGTESGGKE